VVQVVAGEMSPRHVFGAMLRFYRSRAGLSQEQLGALIHFSADQVSKVENGLRSPTHDLATACDGVAELKTESALAELWERLQGYFKVRAYPGWFVHWPQIEAQARVLRTFELVAVPGLLQTEGYARAMLSTQVMATPEEIEEMVASRLARQAVLTRARPPMLWVILDEGVLWRPVGDAGVMAAQADRLVAAARLPNVVIQVIPWPVGAHQGMSGNFVIADLPDGAQVVYQDTAARGQIVEDSDDIRSVVFVWDTLNCEALPRTASLALMEEAAQSWTRAASSGASRATAPATAETALRLAPPPAS
jgi:transcriptional regulator with XRE-family HTH domain